MADTICNNCKHFKDKAGGSGDCDVHHTTVHWQGKGCCDFDSKEF